MSADLPLVFGFPMQISWIAQRQVGCVACVALLGSTHPASVKSTGTHIEEEVLHSVNFRCRFIRDLGKARTAACVALLDAWKLDFFEKAVRGPGSRGEGDEPGTAHCRS